MSLYWLVLNLIAAIGLSACTTQSPDLSGSEQDVDMMPSLMPVELTEGERLQVVASTTIIGDVVARVGGEQIDLIVLLEPGQDPHSYEPAPAALTVIEEADVVFVNGFDLEESLLTIIEPLGGQVPVVSISAGVRTRAAEDDDHAADHAVDPHVWMDPTRVQVWADNLARVLSALDPAQEVLYGANAAAYSQELAELDRYIQEQADLIPPDERMLVTNHEALGYFADRYGFEVVGTVFIGEGALAEPSAGDLAALIEVIRNEDAHAIFVETSVSAQFAEILVTELGDDVGVYTLYTGSLGGEGSGAEDYLSMMRLNIDTIVDALR